MKKSEMYRLAQFAVLNSLSIEAEKKLEILRVLMDDENLAKYSERQKEKNNETV